MKEIIVEKKVSYQTPVYGVKQVCEYNDANQSDDCWEETDTSKITGYVTSYKWENAGGDKSMLGIQPFEQSEVRATFVLEKPTTKASYHIDVIPHLEFEHPVTKEKMIYSQTEWVDITPTSDSLLGYWKFDNDLTDSANGFNQGESNNLDSNVVVTYSDDCKSGQCADLNGSSDVSFFYGDVRKDFNNNNSFTFNCWVKQTTRMEGTTFPVYSYGIHSDRGGWLIYNQRDTLCGSSGCYYFFAHTYSPPDNTEILSPNSTSNTDLNEWAYITYVFDKENGQANFYKNGVPAGSQPAVQSINPTTNASLQIGACLWETGYTHNGYFDECTYLNMSLTPEDILALYNNNGVPPVSNTAPTIQDNQVTLTPSGTAGDDFDLSCKFTPLDNDTETLTAYVEWYKDGIVNITNEMPVNNDTSEKTFVLDDANTTIGDKWSCGVQIYDGQLYSDWSNSSETEIVSIANKTDFQSPSIQSDNLKDVYVYDASKESWNMTNDTTSWYEWVTNKKFPDKVYLFLTNAGLDIVDASDNTVWMYFNGGSGKAIEANDFTSVYALDGRVYVGSDKGLYVLDFVDDIILRYDNSNGLVYNDSDPFYIRNNPPFSYTLQDGNKKLASNIVNDVHAKKVKGKHLVAVATDGSITGAVNLIDKETGNIAELDFVEYQTPNKEYKSESVFIADDGTLYYSENRKSAQGKTKLSSKYSIDTYTGTTGKADYSYSSKDDLPVGSPLPKFFSERINDVYVTSGTSRMHLNHNTVYIATEKGVSVIQEVQNNEGVGATKTYSYTGSSESVNYKVLEGQADNVTAVTARSDGNVVYVGTNNGAGLGSVSKISLNSNTLVDSWNTTTDITVVGNDTTSLDFLDGDLLVGTSDSGATQIVEQELDHYLITEKDKHRIVEIDSTGLIHWGFGVYNSAGSDDTHLNNPTDAVRLVNGNTLVADYGNQRILEIDPDGSVVQEIGNATQLSDATYLDGVYSVKKV